MYHFRMKKFSDSSLICDNHLYYAGETTTEFSTIEYLMSVSKVFLAIKI